MAALALMRGVTLVATQHTRSEVQFSPTAPGLVVPADLAPFAWCRAVVHPVTLPSV